MALEDGFQRIVLIEGFPQPRHGVVVPSHRLDWLSVHFRTAGSARAEVVSVHAVVVRVFEDVPYLAQARKRCVESLK